MSGSQLNTNAMTPLKSRRNSLSDSDRHYEQTPNQPSNLLNTSNVESATRQRRPSIAEGGLKPFNLMERRKSRSFNNLSAFHEQLEKKNAENKNVVQSVDTVNDEDLYKFESLKFEKKEKKMGSVRGSMMDRTPMSNRSSIMQMNSNATTPFAVREKHSEISQDIQGILLDGKLPAKLLKLGQNITAITDKTRNAREELERMIDITAELKQQCHLQDQECIALEEDKSKVKEEIDSVSKRIELLLAEKKQVEQKIDDLRAENAKLEEILESHRNDVFKN